MAAADQDATWMTDAARSGWSHQPTTAEGSSSSTAKQVKTKPDNRAGGHSTWRVTLMGAGAQQSQLGEAAGAVRGSGGRRCGP